MAELQAKNSCSVSARLATEEVSPRMDEDLELLRRYASDGCERAFAQLVQRNVDLVYSAAVRRLRGDTHAAADVTQEVFTALAVQARSLLQCRALVAWLYATTRNVAVNFIRAEQRRRSREREAHIMHELTATSPDTRDWEQVRLHVDTAMDELSETDRAALVMRFFARRSLAGIGAVLDITEDAARMRVNRALDKLQSSLSRRGITSSALALSACLTQHATLAAPAGLAVTIARGAVHAGAAAAHGTWFGLETGKAAATLLSVDPRQPRCVACEHSELFTAVHRALRETGGTGVPPPHAASRVRSGAQK